MANFNLNVGGIIGAILAAVAAGILLSTSGNQFAGYDAKIFVFSIIAGAVGGTLIWRKLIP